MRTDRMTPARPPNIIVGGNRRSTRALDRCTAQLVSSVTETEKQTLPSLWEGEVRPTV
jgi:hypothetical protein